MVMEQEMEIAISNHFQPFAPRLRKSAVAAALHSGFTRTGCQGPRSLNVFFLRAGQV